MVKKSILLIIICLIISACSVNSNKNITNKDITYKIIKKKINLLPIVPYSILGLSSYLYKDSNGLEYLIFITPKIKEYSWLIDTVKFDKKSLKNKDSTSFPEIPINLFLKETIELKFSVKVLNKNIKDNNSVNLILPYCIFINNKKTNKLILLKDKEINLNLENDSSFIIAEELKISFQEDELNNLEILVCFKQNLNEFNILKTYINNENIKNRNN